MKSALIVDAWISRREAQLIIRRQLALKLAHWKQPCHRLWYSLADIYQVVRRCCAGDVIRRLFQAGKSSEDPQKGGPTSKNKCVLASRVFERNVESLIICRRAFQTRIIGRTRKANGSTELGRRRSRAPTSARNLR